MPTGFHVDVNPYQCTYLTLTLHYLIYVSSLAVIPTLFYTYIVLPLHPPHLLFSLRSSHHPDISYWIGSEMFKWVYSGQVSIFSCERAINLGEIW